MWVYLGTIKLSLTNDKEKEKKSLKTCKKTNPRQACTPVIPVLGRLRQEDLKFKDTLGYIVRCRPAYITRPFLK
jgi:hypothetical protein